MINGWLRRWLGIDELQYRLMSIQGDLDRWRDAVSKVENYHLRMWAAENSLRKIEHDLKIMAPNYEEAVKLEERRRDAVKERYEISAAEARGISLEAYREELAHRRAKKEAL